MKNTLLALLAGATYTLATTTTLAADEFPSSTIPDVPGWLALTLSGVEEEGQGWAYPPPVKLPWAPRHPNPTYSAVILDADPWSEAIDEGTGFRILTVTGNLPVTLQEVSQVPYGCDANPKTMAAFSTPNELSPQTAWILPTRYANARTDYITGGAAAERPRSWALGEGAKALRAELKLTGKHAGRLEIKRGQTVLYSEAFEKHAMDGADMSPINLTKDMEVGVPYPEAIFHIDPKLSIYVFRRMSYEGVHFDVFALRDDKLEKAGSQYVYLCAM